MFTEILKIKPKLDNASAKQAENSLSKRFGRVSKKFGAGLKGAIKGNLLFMSLGMIAGMLNPLKDVEERFKALMGQGNDLQESADMAGTTPAKMQVLRDTAFIRGNITPDKLDGMIASFTNAVEKARDEQTLINKSGDKNAKLSEESSYVKDWLDSTDMAEAFSEFTQSLKSLTDTSGMDNLSDGTGLALRNKVETSVLGEKQKGSAKKFIETDFSEFYKAVAPKDTEVINRATKNITEQSMLDRVLETQRRNNDYIDMSGQLNNSRVTDMSSRATLEDKKIQDQARAYETLSKMASGLEEITSIVRSVMELMAKGFGEIGQLLKMLHLSRTIRGAIGSLTGDDK